MTLTTEVRIATPKEDEPSVIFSKSLKIISHHEGSISIISDDNLLGLYSCGDGFNHVVKAKTVTRDKKLKDHLKSNTLIVDVNILLSNKENKLQSKVIQLPIKVPAHNIYAVSVMEDKQDFTQQLDIIHNQGKVTSPQKSGFNQCQSKGPSFYKEKPSEATEFFHSEQALFYFLSQQETINDMLERVRDHGVKTGDGGAIIEGIIIDMYSTRYICGNCELSAQGMRNENSNFIKQFKIVADDIGYRYLDNLPIIYRIMAEVPDKSQHKKTATGHLDDESLRTLSEHSDLPSKLILQADIDNGNYQPDDKLGTDLHNRTVFSSSINGQYYQTGYEELIKHEYKMMISEGEAFKLVEQDKEFYRSEKYWQELIMLDHVTSSDKEMKRKVEGIFKIRSTKQKETKKMDTPLKEVTNITIAIDKPTTQLNKACVNQDTKEEIIEKQNHIVKKPKPKVQKALFTGTGNFSNKGGRDI